MKANSIDRRQWVLTDCDGGMGKRPVAREYTVSKAWGRRLKLRRREHGAIGPRTAAPRSTRSGGPLDYLLPPQSAGDGK